MYAERLRPEGKGSFRNGKEALLRDDVIHGYVCGKAGQNIRPLNFKGGHDKQGTAAGRKETVVIPAAHAQTGAEGVKGCAGAHDEIQRLRSKQ